MGDMRKDVFRTHYGWVVIWDV